MGLGGHLMWTAVAAAIRKEKNIPILPIEHSKPLINSEIFINNPNFTINDNNNYFRVDLSDPALIYLEDGPRVKFKTNEHIITFCCKQLGIENYKLKCEIFLREDEIQNTNKVLKSLPEKYIVIEPHSKLSWMQSRVYPFNKWQTIVNVLRDEIKFVQIGAPNERQLDNVIYLNGKLTFRECSQILKHANLFVSSEGGLVHLANAVATKSIVIYTSYQHPSMTMYPENQMIDIALHRDNILGYKHHALYEDEANKHNEYEIIHFINANIHSF